jgi:VanZ family protein
MRNFFGYIAIALTIAITVGSLVTFDNVKVMPEQYSDKFVHTFAYILLALSWLLGYKQKAKQLKYSILISGIVFFYGIVIEVLQGVLTTNRQSDVNDIVANLVGIVIAFVFFNIIFQKKLIY